MKCVAFLAVFVAVLALAGCGRTAADPARYEGRVGSASLVPDDVRSEPSRPPGYEIIGQVKARCRVDDGVVAIEGELLADVDCSEALLKAALREKAAAVHGEVLVGFHCDVTAQPRGDAFDSSLHTCSALVAARPAGDEHSDAGPYATAVVAYGSPSEAFHVKVRLQPADAAASPRHPTPTDGVSELSSVPPGRVVIGDIEAKCGEGCARSVVQRAVRAAAGRVGASDVVGVACVRHKEGWLCTGRATRPEVDEYAVR